MRLCSFPLRRAQCRAVPCSAVQCSAGPASSLFSLLSSLFSLLFKEKHREDRSCEIWTGGNEQEKRKRGKNRREEKISWNIINIQLFIPWALIRLKMKTRWNTCESEQRKRIHKLFDFSFSSTHLLKYSVARRLPCQKACPVKSVSLLSPKLISLSCRASCTTCRFASLLK